MEMREVYADCLAHIMRSDPRVCILDADLSKANGTYRLREEFSDRMFNCGVAEQNMASIAAGLSSYGFLPYIETFAPFATRRICDQIMISIAYAKQNVKIIGSDPGIFAELNGGTHMSFEDIGVLRSIPDIVIVEPVDEFQLRAAMYAIHDYVGSVYIRLFRKQAPIVFNKEYEFDLFAADKLQDGDDLSIFVTGQLTSDTIKAVDILNAEGINCDLINIHTIKPIDLDSVRSSALKTGAVLTVENHNIIGGLHSAVLEALGEYGVPALAVGIHDEFGEVGKEPYLRKRYGLTIEDIVDKAKKAVEIKGK